MTLVTRYDTVEIVRSALDPIEDLTSWIAGLRSADYVSDILSGIHGIAPKSAVRRAASLAAHFSSTALGLLEQAFSGPAELSFLPLYYAVLNLSKIYIVLAGRSSELATNRKHGASYDPSRKTSHHLLTEQLTIWPKGVFPLFYSVLTDGHALRHARTISLGSVYPYIHGISHEYHLAYRHLPMLQLMSIHLEGDSATGWRLHARILQPRGPEAENLRNLRAVSGFRRMPGSTVDFVSVSVRAPGEATALDQLHRKVRRFLLYETALNPTLQPTASITPISSRHLMLPEEMPIWLAFNHLSSIVRYNPEVLKRIEDSKAWPMLLAMRKHCTLRFLLLFWSNLHQTEYRISAE